MEQTNLPVLASAHGIDLLGHQNSQWVDGEIVGIKCGYQFPAESIRRLYNRHKNEFKEGETSRVNLTRDVGASGRSKRGHYITGLSFQPFCPHKGRKKRMPHKGVPHTPR
ncbi:MAG: hypothetical protein HZB80_11400 [Deltaproteobacteria bacterium]|nr:hypothetical protein [Deltaproteobacteria bacterium]